MADKKVYSFDENDCKEETYPKASIDELLEAKQDKILYGTELPTTLEDGKIFLLIK